MCFRTTFSCLRGIYKMSQKLEAIVYQKGLLKILNQKKLPLEFLYENCTGIEDSYHMIKSMKVRGAPAIAITAALGLAVELQNRQQEFSTPQELRTFVQSALMRLGSSRPTAVNLFDAIKKITLFLDENFKKTDCTVENLAQGIIHICEVMLEKDISDNKRIGEFGAQAILEQISKNLSTQERTLNILTHCNTGSLATAGYGTALGIIRNLNENKMLKHAFCTETRPYNQGSRLTAFELVYEKIPATLIADSMVAFLMKTKQIHAVVVGADRVVNNGDTANKIGTYQIALSAQFHEVPFFVAAPSTSLDLEMLSGEEIVIEERPSEELTHIEGFQIAASGINTWNPGFDITPGGLIRGIITEKCIVYPEKNGLFNIKKALS
jgi:methylthioribose-1-phosphate isomerase